MSVVFSWVYIIFAVMASSFPHYSFYTLFKMLLLIVSFFIVLYESKLFLLKDRTIFLVVVYFIFLLLCVRVVDEYSMRIVFNMVVLIVASYAALYVRVTVLMLSFSIVMCLTFLVYSYFNNVNIVDGKPQVHAQVMTLVFLLGVLLPLHKNIRAAIATFIVIGLSKVRSTLVGFVPLLGYSLIWKSGRLSFTRYVWYSYITSVLLFFYIVSESEYFWILLGSSFDSLSWRVLHWNNLLADFQLMDWIFGRGLGYTWRESLNIDAFYADGYSYIASHSNYVKIVGETGAIGLIVWFSLVIHLYRESSENIRALLLLYLVYSFFDEGMWMFNLPWLIFISRWGRYDFNYYSYKR